MRGPRRDPVSVVREESLGAQKNGPKRGSVSLIVPDESRCVTVHGCLPVTVLTGSEAGGRRPLLVEAVNAAQRTLRFNACVIGNCCRRCMAKLPFRSARGLSQAVREEPPRLAAPAQGADSNVCERWFSNVSRVPPPPIVNPGFGRYVDRRARSESPLSNISTQMKAALFSKFAGSKMPASIAARSIAICASLRRDT
jgi:hypothetical protein